MRIRLPEGVKTWLVERARRNVRSQTAEITVILQKEMAAEAAKNSDGDNEIGVQVPAAATTTGIKDTDHE